MSADSSQAVFLEMAMQLLVKAGLHPGIRVGMRHSSGGEDGNRCLSIEIDWLPVALIRRGGLVEIGVVEVVGNGDSDVVEKV